MSKHPEHEEKHVASDSRKSSDSKAADSNTTPSEAALMRLKLRLIANYAMRGFAPAVAVLALVIAVVAIADNKSSQAQLAKAAARIDSLSENLSSSRSELEKLKAAIAQEKTMQEERVTKIIQGVTQLQVITHISPTLEEELHQPARVSVATPPAANTAALLPQKP